MIENSTEMKLLNHLNDFHVRGTGGGNLMTEECFKQL